MHLPTPAGNQSAGIACNKVTPNSGNSGQHDVRHETAFSSALNLTHTPNDSFSQDQDHSLPLLVFHPLRPECTHTLTRGNNDHEGENRRIEIKVKSV